MDGQRSLSKVLVRVPFYPWNPIKCRDREIYVIRGKVVDVRLVNKKGFCLIELNEAFLLNYECISKVVGSLSLCLILLPQEQDMALLTKLVCMKILIVSTYEYFARCPIICIWLYLSCYQFA